MTTSVTLTNNGPGNVDVLIPRGDKLEPYKLSPLEPGGKVTMHVWKDGYEMLVKEAEHE